MHPCGSPSFSAKDFFLLTQHRINSLRVPFRRLRRFSLTLPAVAQDNYLPHVFGYRGRLVYTCGIVVLAVLTCFLLVVSNGVTDKLISRYAVGGFLAFRLSQSAMVMHWRIKRGPHWVKSTLNGLGGLTVLVVLVAKFTEGASITVIFIPL
jgi:hypothetical protein